MTTFPRNILTTRAISSYFTAHFTLRSQFPTRWYPSFNFFVKPHLPWVRGLFPLALVETEENSSVPVGQAPGQAQYCRHRSDPSPSSQCCSFPGPGLNTSELHFIICKLNNSLPHILRILYSGDFSEFMRGMHRAWSSRSVSHCCVIVSITSSVSKLEAQEFDKVSLSHGYSFTQ